MSQRLQRVIARQHLLHLLICKELITLLKSQVLLLLLMKLTIWLKILLRTVVVVVDDRHRRLLTWLTGKASGRSIVVEGLKALELIRLLLLIHHRSGGGGSHRG